MILITAKIEIKETDAIQSISAQPSELGMLQLFIHVSIQLL